MSPTLISSTRKSLMYVKRGELDSRFTVAARTDFQTFSKIFRFHNVVILEIYSVLEPILSGGSRGGSWGAMESLFAPLSSEKLWTSWNPPAS